MPLPTLDKLRIIPPQPASAKLQAMEFNDRSRRTDIAEDRNAIAREGQDIQRESQNIRKEELETLNMFKAINYASQTAANQDQWNEIVKKITGKDYGLKFNGQDMEQIITSGGKDYKLKGKSAMVLDFYKRVEEDPTWLTDPQKSTQALQYMTQNGLTIEPVEEKAPTNLVQAWLKNHPNATDEEIIAIKKSMSGEGFGGSVTTEPGGATTVQWGSGGGAPLTTSAKTEVQKEVVKIDSALDRARGVMDSYREDYQTYGTRWANKWNAFKEMSGVGKKLTAKDKEELGAITTYRKRAVRDLGLSIHELAGATVSRNEEKLFTGGLPDPGTGLFDGDSPTEFEAALVDSYTFLLKAKARHMWYLKQELTDSDIANIMKSETQISLADTMNRINDIGEQKLQEITAKEPEINQVEAKERVKMFLKAEFGLEF